MMMSLGELQELRWTEAQGRRSWGHKVADTEGATELELNSKYSQKVKDDAQALHTGIFDNSSSYL